MQSVTIGKVRIIHCARKAHGLTIFLVFWKQNETTLALEKLGSCETLLKNPITNVWPVEDYA